jgi:hypothetical protein
MHPILAHRRRLTLYLWAWLPVGFLLAVLAVVSGPGAVPGAAGEGLGWWLALALTVPPTVAYGLLNLSSWYLCRTLPLGSLRPGEENPSVLRLGLAHLLAAGLSTFMWLVLGVLWARLLALLPWPSGLAAAPETFAALFPLFVAAGVLLYLLAAAVHYLLMAFEASRAAEARALESRVLAREAELRALRAQINPHFLFNSLNSISARIGSNPPAARHMCISLADFFRGSLQAGAREAVTLGEELALAERYLEIEEARYGERLRLRREVDPDALQLTVPPLILQPLVENAVGHGIAHLLEGGEIRLTVEQRPEAVVIAVHNPRDPDAPPSRGAGIGQNNVRNRLERRYGDGAWLAVSATVDAYRAEVHIPREGVSR